MRRYLLNEVMNMRDLGGYPAGNSAYTKYKKFIRSDAPMNLNENDIKFLLGMNLKTIVDLRNPNEINKNPSTFSKISDFNYYNYPLWTNVNIFENEEQIKHSYFNMVENKEIVYSIMKLFANTEGSILFHCQAGKDRTGVIASLLLSLANVPVSDILADYTVSYIYIKSIIDKFHQENIDAPAYIGQSKPEYMDEFLKLFFSKYESTENYLHNIGLRSDEIQRIKNKLIM